ncbi:MAG: PEGA domain-containing protein, partial [Chitinispirillales bacterium]|nr:PEGA domain-containing protein [Chitinispirillales bacterium]
MRRRLIFSAVMAAAIVCFAQLPDPHTIADFNITDTTLILESGFAIKRPPSDTLLSLEYPPQFIKPGEIVMRKKFGPDYKLYSGEFDETALKAFPALNIFEIPKWSGSGQIMWYRIYSSPENSRGLDEEVVFFDNERIYLQHHETIYYSRNDKWYTLQAVNKTIRGALSIESEPQGADIYIYGKSTGYKTPALINNLIAGKYETELFLPDYNFQRKTLTVKTGEVSSASFELISDIEPLLVLGENQHGILVLPHPPLDSAYLINGSPVTSLKNQLAQGEYHLWWRGGDLYKDVDTLINIEAGKMFYFNVPFVRLAGKAVFELEPKDALVCVEGFPCRWGELSVELPSGFHTARISRHGYFSERRKFSVSHDKISRVKVALELNSDRDGDGFPDSVDKCPDVYGLYDGCPKPKFMNMVMIKAEEINEYVETEPFSFAISAMGLISRSPTNRKFHNFLSSFSGGRTGGLNNYQGFTISNIYQAAFRGFIGQIELGQWSSGI